MTEFADGGIIKGESDYKPVVSPGCDYVISPSFAKRYQALLDRINQGLDSDTDVVVD